MRATPLIALAAGLVSTACGTAPEARSGLDAHLGGAEPLKVGKLAAGDLDGPGGDTTDWRAADLPEGGAWQLTFSTEPASARVAVGVYDRTGELLGAGLYPPAGGGELVLAFEAAEAGRVHIRLMHRGDLANTWGLKVSRAEAAAGGRKKPVLD